jgi:N-acyl-D-aspartate/D-glutamate deacylase
MSYDLKIVGGTLVDGSGGPTRRADVGIRDGRIVEVGDLSGAAGPTLDAEGAIVTPGFIDVHSHYDGQVTWDEQLLPTAGHGVTTCVLGNCGVGFAPVRPADRQRLIELFEGVEDIPGSALAEGIRWRWESFPEYLSAIDFPHTIDFLTQVPHDALRVYAMGERALAGEAAGDDDITRMQALLHESLQAGAVGFSTGRTDNHRAKSGAATPASEAGVRELCGLAEVMRQHGRGVLQAVSDFDMAEGPQRFDAEYDVLLRMAEAAGGRPLSLSLMQRDQDPDQWRRILLRSEQACARGVPIRVQVAPRAIGVLLGLEASFHPFMGYPSYKAIAHLPLAERVRHLSDPQVRARLLSERSEPVAGDGSPIPPLADKLLARLDFVSMRLFRWSDRPRYEPTPEESICAEAQQRGVSYLAAVYDALLANGGEELLYFPLFNYTEWNLDNVRAMLTHPLALAGLSDGGAHVGTICDASFPTFLLQHWVRERSHGRLHLEHAVERLTSAPAAYLGLRDRGRIVPGLRADLNVIELDRLTLRKPRLVRDLPAGGKRFLQDAEGYRATLVGGEIVARDGRLTGRLPGRLVRAG